MNETFSQKLTLLLIDKFFLALIIAVAGYIISKMLERYKSKQALFNEIAKEEIKRISDCWQLAYESESLIMRIVRRTAEIQHENEANVNLQRDLLNREIEPLFTSSTNKTAEFLDCIDKNRLWINNNLFDTFRKFHKYLITYLEAYAAHNIEQLKTSQMEIENLKQSINQILFNINTKR
jgi:hypothetical protein